MFAAPGNTYYLFWRLSVRLQPTSQVHTIQSFKSTGPVTWVSSAGHRTGSTILAMSCTRIAEALKQLIKITIFPILIHCTTTQIIVNIKLKETDHATLCYSSSKYNKHHFSLWSMFYPILRARVVYAKCIWLDEVYIHA